MTRSCGISALLALLMLTSVVPAAQTAAGRLAGVVRVDGKPHKDVVIWLEGAASGTESRPSAIMDQRNLEFIPRVLAVRVGTHVKMPNSDRIFHNVFSFHDGKRFDLGLYPVGTTRVVTFDAAGVSRIFCNIHPNMAAYVVAVDSPFFAVTDGQGRFTIEGVSPGSYAYHLWRSGREPGNGTVAVRPGQPVELEWP
jgi:plastocyanin